MTDKALLRTGIMGSVVVALCCFTPLLVVVFGVFGVTAATLGWLDFVLLPLLAVFLGLTGYALMRRRRAP